MVRTKPTLYLFIGYPGAGKTTVAKWIVKHTGAAHLWADVERHRKFLNPTHSEAESRKLYEELNVRAEQLLGEGTSVVFDTNFNHYQDRQLLRRLAGRHGADTLIIWVATPLRLARDRAVHAQVVRNGYDFTMSGQQFDAIAGKLEPPHSDEKVIKIDGTNLDADQVMRLVNSQHA